MKTALITGANRSIGLETARRLAGKGYFVYLGSRDLSKGNEVVDLLKREGLGTVEALQIDVSDSESILAAREIVRQKSGGLDILINNAGISGGFPQTPSQMDTDTIRRVFDTNFFGTIQVTQIFLELLKKSDTPRIVNVTSGLASLTLHSDPTWQYHAFKGAAYGPSKTALNAFTVALAYELRETAFKINAVDPGFTATDFNQHRGTGKIDDAADFIIKYALIGNDGPTGKFFSKDLNGEGDESPW
ncbi:short-chain dehydrogenase [Prolixibacter bellariivorans]|uniref:Short-chain dehydrogenase n=1 Tax=Prolixibacter bellariivorans TaxID=314319 RepID=A0A5M4B3I8_9BACT|nr:SDR family oxidoreductase [Prolixibacter bellariivorans]GET34710.1 short-chain dehydrogenase [Prolixibacter bellariivorans]